MKITLNILKEMQKKPSKMKSQLIIELLNECFSAEARGVRNLRFIWILVFFVSFFILCNNIIK